MNNEEFRQMIIDLLDDEHGINEKAFNRVSLLAENTGNDDIVSSTSATEGRWYLGEDDAEELRQVNIIKPSETPIQ